MIMIKINPITNEVDLAGTIQTPNLKSKGYIKYTGTVPNAPFLKWDPVTSSLIEDTAALTEHISNLRKSKISQLSDEFSADVAKLSNASPHEMVSWKKQEDEARAYIVDNTIATPFLTELVVSRGLNETVAVLANKIIANADAYSKAYAILLGKYQRLVAKVNTLTTRDEINSIYWAKPVGGIV